MAKKNDTPVTDEFTTPKRVYVGPVYHLGIQLPDQHPVIRPAEFSDEEIEAFLAARPQYADWWISPEYTAENQ